MAFCTASNSTAIVPHASSTAIAGKRAAPGTVGERATTSNPYGSVATTQQGLHMSAFTLDEKSLRKQEVEWGKWCGKDSSRTLFVCFQCRVELYCFRCAFVIFMEIYILTCQSMCTIGARSFILS